MMSRSRLAMFAAGALLALAVGPEVASADTITYTLATTNNANGNPVAAQAVFTLTNVLNAGNFDYTMTIDLKDTLVLANGESLAPNQFLSQLDFNLSVSPIGSVTVNSQSAPNGSINYPASGSTPTFGSITPTWTFPTSGLPSGFTYQLNGILGGTKQMIAPQVAPNGSVFMNGGVDNFNPYIYKDALFTLKFTAASSSVTVNKVAFNFGTTQGEYQGSGSSGPDPVGIPEIDPGSSVSALACLALGLMMFRSRGAVKLAD